MNPRWSLGVAALAICLSVCGCAKSSLNPKPNTFRVMTYNIHHGEGLDGKVDVERIATLINSQQVDIVALQEVDKGVERTARQDLGAQLAQLTGLECVFSNNYHFQGGEYGNAVLTRFPVVRGTNSHFTMLHAREQRGILQLVLNVHGRQLALLNTHLDAGHDDAERWSEVAEIQTLTASHQNLPLLLCGDFNATPDSRVIRKLSERLFDTWELVGRGEGFTSPAPTGARRIDYLWISKDPSLVPRKAWLPRSDASDHLPLVAEFELR